MELTDLIIIIVGGFAAGFLNSLAGFGSVITLSIYMDLLGLPGHIANATNRVNVLASSGISALTFFKNGKLDLKAGKWHIIAVATGAIIGILIAADFDDQQFKTLFNYLLLPILLIILVNPKNFINPDRGKPPISNFIIIPLLFVFGLYAGLIQVGFGLLFLIVAVMLAKYDLIESNALKVAIVAIYTVIAIAVFHFNGLINWKYGLMIAVSQGFGGYLAAQYASKLGNANKYAYYLLVTIIVAVIIKNFELWKWLTF